MYVIDVSCVVGVVLFLLLDNCDIVIVEVWVDYVDIVECYVWGECGKKCLLLDEVWLNVLWVDFNGYVVKMFSFFGIKVFDSWLLVELVDYIDWILFFQIWEFCG